MRVLKVVAVLMPRNTVISILVLRLCIDGTSRVRLKLDNEGLVVHVFMA